MEGKTGRLGNIDQDSPPIHHRSLYRIGYKIVEEPEGLGGGLKATYVNRAALAGFLFRGQQIHAKRMTPDLERGSVKQPGKWPMAR